MIAQILIIIHLLSSTVTTHTDAAEYRAKHMLPVHLLGDDVKPGIALTLTGPLTTQEMDVTIRKQSLGYSDRLTLSPKKGEADR